MTPELHAKVDAALVRCSKIDAAGEGAKWNGMTESAKLSLLVKLGWKTNKDEPSSVAKSSSGKDWNDLSPAIQNVLKRNL